MTDTWPTARLTVDVAAVVANHRVIADRLATATAAAVVKADAYGLGVEQISESLWHSGCRHFFVARLAEGIQLRSLLPEATIYVFDGVFPGSAPDYANDRLVPVINSLDQLERWRTEAIRRDRALPTVIHIDTGMLRLGLDHTEYATLVERPDLVNGLDIRLVASHLASADEAASEQPEQQLERFRGIRKGLPVGRASLANSAGVFRHADYHFDLVRPGYALYGGHPQPDRGANPMHPVVTVDAPVLQVRSGEAGETVGYGASHRLDRRRRLATIGIGYADGFLRSGSNRGRLHLGGTMVPIVGRISMDLTTVDVTEIPANAVEEGGWVEVIGPHRPIDEVAGDAGTIGYEVLTSLGRRYRRRYVGMVEAPHEDI